MRISSASWAIAVWLTGCGGLSSYNPDTDTDGGGGSDDPNAPVFDLLEPYRNETDLTVRGSSVSATVRVTIDDGSTTEDREVPVVNGVFQVPVELSRGVTTRFTAVGLDGGRETGVSTRVETEACDPPDNHEIVAFYGEGYGDACEPDPVWLEGATSDAAIVETFVGNIHSADDVDWIRIQAKDLPGDREAGFENFRIDARFAEGGETFQMRVLRGSCGDNATECGGEAIDEYSWFLEDTEPDDSGSIPSDPRACGDPPLNACEDWSGDWFIEVIRADDGFDCTPYRLEVSNGVW